MAAESLDRWVCQACRSFNSKRAGTCYRCRAPRELVGATPATLPTIGSTFVPPAVHPYRSARWRARLVVVALVGMHALTTAIVLWVFLPLTPEGGPIDTGRVFPEMPRIAAVWVAAAFVLTTAWAAWISRVVDNLPALGLGYARSSPRAAFLESYMVGPNAIFAPARLREVSRKLDPTGHGPGLVNAAWLAVAGPPAAFVAYYRFARWVLTYGEQRRETEIALPVFWVGATIGIVLALVAVIRVERLSAARHEAIRWGQPASG